jgi:hypothetical protein
LGVNGGFHRGDDGIRYGLIVAVGLHKASCIYILVYDTAINRKIQVKNEE